MQYRLADKSAIYITKRQTRARDDINSIIIHSTGGVNDAIIALHKAAGEDPALTGDFYVNGTSARKGFVGFANRQHATSHFLIDWSGVIWQTTDLMQVAPHAAGGPKNLLNPHEKGPGYSSPDFDAAQHLKKQWQAKWLQIPHWRDPSRNIKTPADLPCWVSKNPNKSSIGIDLLAFATKQSNFPNIPFGNYSGAQFASLQKLVEGLCADFSIPQDIYHVIGHTDMDPYERPHDPGDNFPWDLVVREGPKPSSFRRFPKVAKDISLGYNFNDGTFLTPEERRKGIIAQIYNMSDMDWISYIDGEEKRDLYLGALTEAEYFRRKFASRTVPAIGGPFNPYAVAGFPGLIVTPERPIIAMVETVNHNIDIQSGQASTSVSMKSPRYWDEGDVYFWYGGEKGFKHSPGWQSDATIATNRIDSNRTDLDKFYDFFLDTDAIEFVSNHAGIEVTEAQIKAQTENRDPGPFEIDEDTLSIKEYNVQIAGTDKNGELFPSTIVRRFLGLKSPTSDILDININYDDVISYTERYGVSEKDLMSFLDNDPYIVDDKFLVYKGRSFEENSPLQEMIFQYMEDLEIRKIE